MSLKIWTKLLNSDVVAWTVNGGTKLFQISLKYILLCTKVVRGLEQHEDEQIMTDISFGLTNHLSTSLNVNS